MQLKKGVTIDRDKTSINLNENMDSLVPASLPLDSTHPATGQGLPALDNPKEVGSHRKKLKIHACSA